MSTVMNNVYHGIYQKLVIIVEQILYAVYGVLNHLTIAVPYNTLSSVVLNTNSPVH